VAAGSVALSKTRAARLVRQLPRAIICIMAQYDGTLSDLCEDVGLALTSIQTIIKHMLNKSEFAHLTDSCAEELRALDQVVRKLRPS
jgi:hypothetical protein